VAAAGTRLKIFRHSAVGELHMMTTSLQLPATPENRMIVYTPIDDETSSRLQRLCSFDPVPPPADHRH
jgi:MmyB-like transcription regulator ligand binding domain